MANDSGKPRVSSKEKSRQIISAAYEKSEREEKKEEEACCCPCTLRNVPLFVALFSCLLFARSFLAFYTDSILDVIATRFIETKFRIDFIAGVEKVGFVVTLIFTAYYGRNIHKPTCILFGAFLCCIGAILCMLPHSIASPRSIGNVAAIDTPMMRYLDAGLCQSGRNTSHDFSHNQCDQIPATYPEHEMFSFFCAGKFLIGVGTACFITLGIIYVSEAAKEDNMPLILGILLCMDGLGELVAGLFTWKMASYNEDLAGPLLHSDWDVGPWWAGFPVGAALFFLPCTLLMFFPKWIVTPRWLAIRRRRRLQRLEKSLEDKEKKRQRKARKKSERQTDGATATGETFDDLNEIANTSAEDRERGRKRSRQESGESRMRNGSSEPMAVNNEQDRRKEQNGRKENRDEARRKMSSQSQSGSRNDDTDEPRRKESSETQRKESAEPMRRQKTSEHSLEEFTQRFVDSKPSTSIIQAHSGTRLGRQLADLPENLKYLLQKPEYPIAVLAMGLALYFPYGFHSTITQYMKTQFIMIDPPYKTMAALTHGAGAAVGAFLGGLIVFKMKLSIGREQVSMVIGCLLTSTILMLVLFAGYCDTFRFADIVQDFPNGTLAECHGRCDCSFTELSPVCGTIDGHIVQFPSPCSAGCRSFSPGADEHHYTIYTDCLCGPSSSLSQGFCTNGCSRQTLFYIVYTLATAAHSASHAAVILFFLRFVSTKMRSLSLGFALWLMTLLALPSITIFNAIRDTACTWSSDDCHQEPECWHYDASTVRFRTVGAAAAFLGGSVLCFVIVWILLWRRKSDRRISDTRGVEEGEQSGQTNGGYRHDSVTSS